MCLAHFVSSTFLRAVLPWGPAGVGRHAGHWGSRFPASRMRIPGTHTPIHSAAIASAVDSTVFSGHLSGHILAVLRTPQLRRIFSSARVWAASTTPRKEL